MTVCQPGGSATPSGRAAFTSASTVPSGRTRYGYGWPAFVKDTVAVPKSNAR